MDKLNKITLTVDEHTFRALVRKALRGSAALTEHEELVIEDAFIAVVRKQMKAYATDSAPVEATDPKATCHDRLVTQIATLECVLGVLVQWDLSGRPTDKNCRIGSAELVLRESIDAMYDIAENVETLQRLTNAAAMIDSEARGQLEESANG